jgi:hypothetical protein
MDVVRGVDIDKGMDVVRGLDIDKGMDVVRGIDIDKDIDLIRGINDEGPTLPHSHVEEWRARPTPTCKMHDLHV